MCLKVIGVLIVVTACSLMGFALANEYIAKINNLDAFKKSLRILKGKIKYDNLSVFEAMELIKINNNVIENFYHKVSEVYFMEEKTLFESWKMAVNKYLKKEIKFCFISSGFNIFISELILSPLPPTYLFYCSMLIYVLSNG